MNHFFSAFDRVWCGKTQLPASLITQFSDHILLSYQITRLRFYSAFCVVLQVLGTFFMTFGLFSQQPTALLIMGILLKVVGGVLSSYFQNRSGVLWSLEIQDSLKHLKTHAQEITALLTDKGCSEAEIHLIHQLPTEVYHSELNSYQQTSLLHVFNPLACGLALLLNEEIVTAVLVMSLGLLSFPIGEYFFRNHAFRHESELRLGRSASLISYLKRVYDEHLSLTLQVNALSQAPLILFGLRFLWNSSGQLLATFFGLVQGLAGLTGTLAFQRTRALALQSTKTAQHLLAILNSEAFLITPQRWREHQLQPENLLLKEKELGCYEGVAFVNFSVSLSLQSQELKLLPAINCIIPSQGACIVQAPSGIGKSTFLAATLHLIAHTGDLYLISGNTWHNVHQLVREEFEASVLFFKEENSGKTTRLIDLFKEVLVIRLAALQMEMREQFGPLLTNLAWQAADNLIEQEIQHINRGQPSVFPPDMLLALIQMRLQQVALVNQFCKQAGGNLVTPQIFPERVFLTLSSGEKRRLICTLALERAKVTNQVKLLILDEPLAHLDIQSIEDQIQTICAIQKLPQAPALLIISHLHVTELAKQLLQAKFLVL